MLDRRRIDATDRQVEIDPAEYLKVWNDEAYDIGETGGRLVMVLEDDGAHAARSRLADDFDRINRTRPVVGEAVDVDVDGAGEGAGHRVSRRRLLTLRRGREQRENGDRRRHSNRLHGY